MKLLKITDKLRSTKIPIPGIGKTAEIAVALLLTVTCGCSGHHGSSDRGHKPDWLAGLTPDMRTGYGMSRAQSDPGTLFKRYSFAKQAGSIALDQRTTLAPTVTIQGQPVSTERVDEAIGSAVDTASAKNLYDELRIYVAASPGAGFQDWTDEKVFYFYKTVENLPTLLDQDQGITSVFYLSANTEAQEITPIDAPAGAPSFGAPGSTKYYKVTADAFDFSDIAALFGDTAAPAKYFDNDFFKQFIALFLNDKGKLEELLSKAYGYSTDPDGPAYLYQDFTADELMMIIDMLEDLPPLFRPVAGVTRLVRGNDADPTGLQTTVKYQGDQITFYLAAFMKDTVQDFQENFVSELAKAWATNTLEQDKVIDWRKFSGWQLENGRWLPSRTDNMVSDLATTDPIEDLAESIAYYVVFPMDLLGRAKDKYDFIFGIMGGYQYRITASKDHRFQVVSADPDMTAPVADVSSLQIDTYVNNDGYYTVKVRINVTDDLSGVAGGSIQVYSADYPKHHACASFVPTGQGDTWEATLTISRFAEKGKWDLKLMEFSDPVRNVARYTQENMGWDLFLPDNGYPADKEPPSLDPGSIQLTYYWNDDLQMHEIYASMSVSDNLSDRLYGNLSASISGAQGSDYAWGEFLGYDASKHQMYFVIRVSPYQHSGKWKIYYAGGSDELCNQADAYMDALGRDITFDIHNDQTDVTPPKIYGGNITVQLTDHDPANHEGGYTVDVTVPVSDDLSGVDSVSATVMSPSGQQWTGSASGIPLAKNGRPQGSDGASGRRPSGWGKPAGFQGTDTTAPIAENVYHIQIELPAHVEGGTWILASVVASDRAHNYTHLDLTTRGISISR